MYIIYTHYIYITSIMSDQIKLFIKEYQEIIADPDRSAQTFLPKLRSLLVRIYKYKKIEYSYRYDVQYSSQASLNNEIQKQLFGSTFSTEVKKVDTSNIRDYNEDIQKKKREAAILEERKKEATEQTKLLKQLVKKHETKKQYKNVVEQAAKKGQEKGAKTSQSNNMKKVVKEIEERQTARKMVEKSEKIRQEKIKKGKEEVKQLVKEGLEFAERRERDIEEGYEPEEEKYDEEYESSEPKMNHVLGGLASKSLQTSDLDFDEEEILAMIEELDEKSIHSLVANITGNDEVLLHPIFIALNREFTQEHNLQLYLNKDITKDEYLKRLSKRSTVIYKAFLKKLNEIYGGNNSKTYFMFRTFEIPRVISETHKKFEKSDFEELNEVQSDFYKKYQEAVFQYRSDMEKYREEMKSFNILLKKWNKENKEKKRPASEAPQRPLAPRAPVKPYVHHPFWSNYLPVKELFRPQYFSIPSAAYRFIDDIFAYYPEDIPKNEHIGKDEYKNKSMLIGSHFKSDKSNENDYTKQYRYYVKKNFYIALRLLEFFTSGELTLRLDSYPPDFAVLTKLSNGAKYGTYELPDTNKYVFKAEEYIKIYNQSICFVSDKNDTLVPKSHPSKALLESSEYRPNSCVASVLLSVYCKRFNKDKTIRYSDKDFTYDSIGELIYGVDEYKKMKKDDPKPEIHVKIEHIQKIADKFRLKIVIRDITMNILHEASSNNLYNGRKSLLNFIYENNHLYYLEDEDLNKITKIKKDRKLTIQFDDNNYHLASEAKPLKDVLTNSVYKHDYDYLVNNLTKLKSGTYMVDQEVLTGITKPLNIMYAEIYKKYGYAAGVKMNGDAITEIKFNLNGQKFKIIDHKTSRCANDFSPEDYKQKNILQSKLSNLIFTHGHRSEYSDESFQLFKDFKAQAYVGLLPGKRLPAGELVGIDFSKHYSDILMNLPTFRVFSTFDKITKYAEPIKYSAANINNDTIYIIEFDNVHDMFTYTDGNFQQTHALYGADLKKYVSIVKHTKFVITGEFVPTNVTENTSTEYIRQLYENPTNMLAKKSAVNETIGMMEKYKNNRTKSYVFVSRDELARNMNIFSQQNEQLTLKCTNSIVPLIDDINILSIKSPDVQMINGFLPIKKAILDGSRLKVMEMVYNMQKFGLHPVYVKTDSIYVPIDEQEKLLEFSKQYSIGKNPGQITINKPTTIDANLTSAALTIHRHVEFTKDIVKTQKIMSDLGLNEVDDITDYTIETILKSFPNRLIIHSDQAGSGKSYLTKHIAQYLYKKTGKPIYFITQTNELKVDNIKSFGQEHTLSTSCSAFKMYITKDGKQAKHNEGDKMEEFQKYSCVIIDEIYLNSISFITHLERVMKLYPDVYWIANGDYEHQNKSIDKYNVKDIIRTAVEKIFPDGLLLQIPKRNKRPDFKFVCDELKKNQSIDDAYERQTDLMRIITKYIKKDNILLSMQEYEQLDAKLKFRKSICHDNRTMCALNIHNQLSRYGTKMIQVGQVLRCADKFTHDKQKIQKGFTFTVTKIDNVSDKFTIEPCGDCEAMYDNKKFTLSKKYITKFTSNYSRTNYSVQGLTINEPICVFNLNDVDNLRPVEFAYTALTRNTNLDDVYICLFDVDRKDVSHEIREKYINKKQHICYKCMSFMYSDDITETDDKLHCSKC